MRQEQTEAYLAICQKFGGDSKLAQCCYRRRIYCVGTVVTLAAWQDATERDKPRSF